MEGFPVPGRVALAQVHPGIKMPQASFSRSPTSKLVLEFRHFSVQAVVALIWGHQLSPRNAEVASHAPSPTAALGPTFWGPCLISTLLSYLCSHHATNQQLFLLCLAGEFLAGHLKCPSAGLHLALPQTWGLPNLD